MSTPDLYRCALFCLPILMLLAGCGDDGQGTVLTVGGRLSGITGNTSVTFQNNGDDDLVVGENGNFVFSTPAHFGDVYDVTISAQSEELDCVVANGKGVVLHEKITDVLVTCQSWHSAIRVNAGDSYHSSLEAMAVAANGDAFVIWMEGGSPWVNHYLAGVGWETPRRLSTTENGGGANLAMNDKGEAIAVWYSDPDQTAYKIRSSRYTPDTGWSAAARIVPRIGGSSIEPAITMDETGNAMVVWTRLSRQGNEDTLWAAAYTAGVGWGDPFRMETGDTFNLFGVSVAQNRYGDALALWSRSEANDSYTLWSNRYSSSTGWGPPEQVAINVRDNVRHPGLVLDDNGDAVAVWSESVAAPGAVDGEQVVSR